MALVNLAIARALSRKRFAERIKSASYKKKQKQFELHLTFTTNNIFVNFCNGVGDSMFLKTFGMVGYDGTHRRTRYSLFYFGFDAAEQLSKFLIELEDKLKLRKKIAMSLYLHSVMTKKDFRYRRFMDGFKKYKFRFLQFQYKANPAYNGCKLPAHRRTRRGRTLF